MRATLSQFTHSLTISRLTHGPPHQIFDKNNGDNVKPYGHDFWIFVQGYIFSDTSTKHTETIYMFWILPNLPPFKQVKKSFWTIIFRTQTWIIPLLWMLPIGRLGKGCDEIAGGGLGLVKLGFSQLLLILRNEFMYTPRTPDCPLRLSMVILPLSSTYLR